MRLAYRYLPPIILLVGALIPVWFLIANLQPLQPALYAFIIWTIIGIYFAIKVFNMRFVLSVKKYMRNIARRKYFVSLALVFLALVGVLARLFFYIRFTYSPVSDPMTFYDSAIKIAAGHSLIGDSYIAVFPFLAAYDNILGVVMKLISDPWLATILMNTFFDVASALALFLFLKKILKPTSKLPLLGFGVWILNPLNVVFSVVSLPVIIVNFFIIFAILISYLLIQQVSLLRTSYSIVLSVLLGITIGLGNCFRPVFLVNIIALTIVLIFMYLTTHKTVKFLRLFIVCILLSILIFISIQKLNLAFVSHEIGFQASKNPSGVSLYVGSNWESAGEWRPYINDNMNAICKISIDQKDFDKCHSELRSAAVTRYKNFGVLNLTSLFIRKLYHQAGQQNYFYNADFSIVGYIKSKTTKIINVYSAIYMIILFTLSAKFLYELAKQKVSKQISYFSLILVTLLMIGWFFSFMFVESAPRYSTILYPAFTIFAILALDSKFTNKRIVKEK